MASLGFIDPPLKSCVPPWYERSPLIYLVGILAIFQTTISNIFVGPPNTCTALKQFNLLSPNTLFWSNFIYYPLTNWFEAIRLGWIKTCARWLWDNFDWHWETETWVIVNVITCNTPRTLEFKSCPAFPLWIINWSLSDRQTARQERQADKKTSMLVVVTHLKRLIFNIN